MTIRKEAGYRLAVDIGGTFTDVVYFRDGAIERGKSDTTHYDLKVGVLNALKAAAAKADIGLADAVRTALLATKAWKVWTGSASFEANTGNRLPAPVTVDIVTSAGAFFAVMARTGWRSALSAAQETA